MSVSTRADLERELCRRRVGNLCTDASPRTIEVFGTIDFRSSEGWETATGCYYDRRNPQKALLMIVDPKNTGAGIVKQPITYDKAGRDPLLVGSNKIVVGHDALAIIERRGLALRHVQNVVIRNLTITDINPAVIRAGDALELSDVRNITIDHNLFSLVGRHMVVGHFGREEIVTLSWNIFDGRTPFYSQGHYWDVLFIADQPTTVTISNKWFRTFSWRSPALNGQGRFDIVNNLFQNDDGHALEMYDDVEVLMEGNVFDNVDQPIVKAGGRLFALADGDGRPGSGCQAVLGRPCEANRVAGARTVQGFDADPTMLGDFARLVQSAPRKTDEVAYTVSNGAGPR